MKSRWRAGSSLPSARRRGPPGALRPATLFPGHGPSGEWPQKPFKFDLTVLVLYAGLSCVAPGGHREDLCWALRAACRSTAHPHGRPLSHCLGLFLTCQASGSKAKNTTSEGLWEAASGYFGG